MIIKELSKFIILDEIRTNANSSEIYFLSHLLDNEMLTIADNWPGRIYTSVFIFDILSKKKPEANSQYFKTLLPNVPVKLRSNEKTIMVTMFETGEITNNVMFFFDDGTTTFLYTGVFTEIGCLYGNELFMSYVEKGIDNVYVDTTRCKGTSYIFTEDTVEEIKQISNLHPDSKLAMIVPTFGYEKLLVELAKEFPQEVYPTKNQRRILSKLGYKDLLSKTVESRIRIHLPGITPEFIESTKDVVTVYIIQGKAPTTTSVCGMYLKQWSPLPSLMDLQALLDIIRPNNIFPIRKIHLEENTALPASLKWFTAKRRAGRDEVRSNADTTESHESETDNDSICSMASSTSTRCGGTTEIGPVSHASTREFVHPACRSKELHSNSAKEYKESSDKVQCSNADTTEYHESETDNDSICSMASSTSTRCGGTTEFGNISQAPTQEFVHPACRSKELNLNSTKEYKESSEKIVKPAKQQEAIEPAEKVVSKSATKNYDLTPKRRRIVRQRQNQNIEFADSDEDE